MLANSIRQPFASAIMCSLKSEVFRSSNTSWRGPLLIHTSRALETDAFAAYPNFDPNRIPCGVILGAVDVTDCLKEVYGGYSWLFERPRWLPTPIPWKDELELFRIELPDDLATMMKARSKSKPAGR
jgi:hypothetical protein